MRCIPPLQAKEEITSRYRAKPRHGQKSAEYAAMIQSVDESVGRIMSALEEANIAERTVIIFTGDKRRTFTVHQTTRRCAPAKAIRTRGASAYL